MNPHLPEDLGSVPMLELFRIEAEIHTSALTSGLLEIESGAVSSECLETLMRAAHSLKGAARIADLPAVGRLAHSLEDCFEAARHGRTRLGHAEIDLLLGAVDVLLNLIKNPSGRQPAVEETKPDPAVEMIAALSRIAAGSATAVRNSIAAKVVDYPRSASPAGHGAVEAVNSHPESFPMRKPPEEERVLRLTAENLNRLLGLAGESLVESRWLKPFSDSLQRLKRHHLNLAEHVDKLRQVIEEGAEPERMGACFSRLAHELAGVREYLADRVQDLDAYDRRSAHLSQRLYLEVLRTRMRPFSDGVRRFPRLVRDLARSLDKQVRIEFSGESTQVDRDILERLETPLGHLLRNAVDHGCEPSDTRVRSGKPAEALIRVEARHNAGVLLVTVADDGAGVHLDELRRALVLKQLTTPAQANKLTEAELLEFLFLPGFTLKEAVSDISGRGYGLDIVQNMVRNVRGAIRLQNHPGRGLRVQLQLPLTLSVLRALLVEVAGEPYAIPLSRISRALRISASAVHMLEGQHYFSLGDQQIGIVSAHQVLEAGDPPVPGEELDVVVLGERSSRYGLIVDRFLGERELVVQPLQARLGKIKDVSAAALMEDGAPALILDVEDIVRSMQAVIANRVSMLKRQARTPTAKRAKRVLVVDDSSTVRQLEQRLLTERGYATEVAVDGLEAWSAVRNGNFDLVITDIEMPRMDGFELARSIKQEPDLQKTAVLIISYKDREEDRLRGLEAGADYYLTKGSFHDRALLQAVVDLIGEPGI